MKQVVNTTRKKSLDKQKMAVLRLEMNYELAVLYEAIQDGNEELKFNAKQKLEKIRQELIKLEAL